LAAKKVAEIVRKSAKEIIVVDAALLLEAGWDKFLQEVWTVFVPREEAVKRVSARDNIPIEQVPLYSFSMP
jgi:dephospho-CoA kinase